jgi:23S rRNA (cytidine1920-2'-O)/16S rRNA (cytidine1409-2'-O)-methyltransferase
MRLDQLLVERQIFPTRAKAQRAVMAGHVLVNGQIAQKSSQPVAETAEISIKSREKFVSRGGEKLDAALENFKIPVKNCVCVDIGASTGGFTDCLLQRGARKVYAVDVGKGVLDWKLRQDSRVVVLEEVNARYLKPDDIGEPADIVTIDVSFISLTKILPAAAEILRSGGTIIALVKPQFEAGRASVGKGGVVRDAKMHEKVLEKIRAFAAETLQFRARGTMESPLRGPAGNKEFLMWLEKP